MGKTFQDVIAVQLRGFSFGTQTKYLYEIIKLYKHYQLSIAEQECIVKILDKFDALVNDIAIGLPAELSVRRSQYEYYRNKLLTFNELKVVDAGLADIREIG